jgi:DNA-binding NtrC family response regulator
LEIIEMNTEKEIHALIVEKDATVAGSIRKILEARQYAVTLLSRKEDARRLLKERHVSLAVAGGAEDSDSPFHIMKEIVMTSPMTSMILITDLPKEEVDEKAEGYGILGHAGRQVKPEEMTPLLDSFEKILGYL